MFNKVIHKKSPHYHKLLTDQVKLLYVNSYGGNAVAVIAALLIPMMLWNAGISHKILIAWMVVNLSASLFQFIFVTVFLRKKKFSNRNSGKWGNFFTVWIACFGVFLGSSGIFLFPEDSIALQIFIFFFMGGMAAGAVGTMAVKLESYISFSIPTLFPITVRFFLFGEEMHTVIGWLMVLFFGVMVLTAKRVFDAIAQSFIANYEKDNVKLELERSEERFSKAFNSNVVPMIIVTIDEGKIYDLNERAWQLLQSNKNKIIGSKIEEIDFFIDAYVWKIISNEINSNGFAQNVEARITTKENDIRYCYLSGVGIKIIEEEYLILMIDDITYQVNSRRELIDEKEKAEKATVAKSQFLARMSHEIRTPMNAIIGMTNLAKMSDDDGEKNEYLDILKESADHLLVIINDLLDFSKIEAGKIKLDYSDFNLHDLCESVIRTMMFNAEEKSLKLSLNIDEKVHPYIRGDQYRLRQILINLLSNAIKFTDRGKIELIVTEDDTDRIGLSGSSDSQLVAFYVKDTGIGIPEDQLAIIFDSFTQVDDNIVKKHRGTGLGLAICKELVNIMGGTTRVESKVGTGSTFYFTIPLKKGTRPVDDFKKEMAHKGLENVVLNILLAEDNRVNQKLAMAVLKKMGHSCDLAEDGEKVIKMLKEKSYDAVLMDVEMPGINGFDATRMIRAGEAGEDRKDIPIIAMSAHVISEIRDEGMKAGMNDYITKPVDFIMLGSALLRIIQNRD